MVKQIEKQGKKYFQCEICGFYYKSRAWAENCEKFCRENNACSIEITKHSVEI